MAPTRTGERTMAMALTMDTLKQAFCKVVEKTGVAAAAGDCDGVMARKVKVVVPLERHGDYPDILLTAAKAVCTAEPYGWGVIESKTSIDDETTFQDVFRNWFKKKITSA